MPCSSGIEGPVELGIVVDALQYRDTQAVLTEQIFICGDVDLDDSKPGLMEYGLRRFAEVAGLGAVEFGSDPDYRHKCLLPGGFWLGILCISIHAGSGSANSGNSSARNPPD